MLEPLEQDTDLVILLETFSTGFSMHAEKLAEGEQGKAVSWMKRFAREKSCYLCGSMIFREINGLIYNRLLWVSPAGIEDCYDKRHVSVRAGRKKTSHRARNGRSSGWAVSGYCHRFATIFVFLYSAGTGVTMMLCFMWPTGLRHDSLYGRF
jgi:hypothetical protein